MSSIKNHEFFDGFKTFVWLTDITGISLDKINFMVVYSVSFVLAGFLRSSLSPEKVTPATRHAFCIFFGLIFGYFCFGKHAIHLTGFSTLLYAVISTQDPKFLHIQVFIVAMFYLSCIHLYLQFFINYGSYTLDVSGPIMIMTGKVTSLACSLHDGIARREEDLTPLQKKRLVKEKPTILEYYSYMLNFLTIMAGPLPFYDEYMDFIYNRRIREAKLQNKNYSEKELQASMTSTAVKKVFLGFVPVFVAVPFIHSHVVQNMIDDEFLKEKSMLYKIWYLNISTSLVRCNYYYAWIFADAICNNAGFGFNGFDENGQPRMDLLTNVNMWGVESAISMNAYIKDWNKVTIRWIRLVVYERVPQYRTVISLIISTVWHGYYPGYYLSAVHGTLYIYAGRSFHRHVRPYFLESKILKFLYDVFTTLATRIAVSYFALSFIIFEFEPAMKIYRDVYFFQIILALIAITFPPILLPIKTKISKSDVKNNENEDNKNKID